MLQNSKINFPPKGKYFNPLVRQQKPVLRLIDLNKQKETQQAQQKKPIRRSYERLKTSWSQNKKHIDKLQTKVQKTTKPDNTKQTIELFASSKIKEVKKQQTNNNLNWKQLSCLQLLTQLQKSQIIQYNNTSLIYQISKVNLIDFVNAFKTQWLQIQKKYLEIYQNYQNLKKYLMMTCPKIDHDPVQKKQVQGQLTIKNKLEYYKNINNNLLLSLKHLTKMEIQQFNQFKKKIMKFRPSVQKELMRQLATVTKQKNDYKMYLNFLTKDIHQIILNKIDWRNINKNCNENIQKQVEQVLMSIQQQISKQIEESKKVQKKRRSTIQLIQAEKRLQLNQSSISKSQNTIKQFKKSTFELAQESSEEDQSEQILPQVIEELQEKFERTLKQFRPTYRSKLNLLRKIYYHTIFIMNSTHTKQKVVTEQQSSNQYLSRFYQLLDRFQILNNKTFFLCEKYQRLIPNLNLDNQQTLIQQLKALKLYCRENMIQI